MTKTKPAQTGVETLAEYVLPIPHEHAGTMHQAGDKIMLYPDQIALIEAVAAKSASKPA